VKGKGKGKSKRNPSCGTRSSTRAIKENQVPTTQRTETFNEPTKWETFPTKPPVCGGNDGLPDQLDGITFSKWRSESLKAYGNAIVPQVAFEIFKVIQKIENGETL
jgi:DNA (cytosine-5)-methyltransferase 1